MSKQVVSFRLSKSDLRTLDQACEKYGMSRTQAVTSGIALLLGGFIHKDGIHNDGTILKHDDGPLLRRAPWFKSNHGA